MKKKQNRDSRRIGELRTVYIIVEQEGKDD